MAHPDDPEFSAGGTIARWTSAGADVTYVVVTDGSKGSDDPEVTAAQLVQIRQAEQRKAANILGVREVLFLDFPDGAVFNNMDLRRELVRAIRMLRPDVLVTHDPTARLIDDSRINHPDHLAVGETALDAVYPLARDRLSFPELLDAGLYPHKVMDIYLTMTSDTNTVVDITASFDLKLQALLAHSSQIGEPEAFEKRMRERYVELAAGTEYQYAERFRRLVLNR